MNLREWFQKAQKEGFAIGAFNVDNLEIFKAICIGAQNQKSPVILEFSPGEADYFGLKNIIDLIINAREDYKIPIFLNLDHAINPQRCQLAIEMPGFDQVHFDGSELELDENIKATKQIVEFAHKKGLLVEGEVNKISGSSELHNEELNLEALKLSYTKPQIAQKFITETSADVFAVVIGNVHGTFPNQPPLDLDLLATIQKSLPNTFLALHGGSGIPAKQVQEAIQIGKIVKVNVNTELRIAYKDALSEQLGENPNQYKIYEYADRIIMAVAAVVEGKIEMLGSANRL